MDTHTNIQFCGSPTPTDTVCSLSSCPVSNQWSFLSSSTQHRNLASERCGAELRLHSAAAVGGAITGALALTLHHINVQRPTLLSCQGRKSVYSSRARLAPSRFLLPCESSQRKRRGRKSRVRFFITHLHNESGCQELHGTQHRFMSAAKIPYTLLFFTVGH